MSICLSGTEIYYVSEIMEFEFDPPMVSPVPVYFDWEFISNFDAKALSAWKASLKETHARLRLAL